MYMNFKQHEISYDMTQLCMGQHALECRGRTASCYAREQSLANRVLLCEKRVLLCERPCAFSGPLRMRPNLICVFDLETKNQKCSMQGRVLHAIRMVGALLDATTPFGSSVGGVNARGLRDCRT